MALRKLILMFLVVALMMSMIISCSNNSKNNAKSQVINEKEISNNSTSSSKRTLNNDKVETKEIDNKNQTIGIQWGLLLGLSSDKEEGEKFKGEFQRMPDKYRSLWLFFDGKQYVAKEKKDSIIAPCGNKFYEIKNEVFNLSEKSDSSNTDDIPDGYIYYYISKNVISNMFGQKRTPLYTEKTFREKYLHQEEGYMGESYKSIIEWPWFIGNEYVCLMDYYYETGGGSYKSGGNSFKLIDTPSLGDLHKRDKPKKLYDLLDQSVKTELNKFVQEYNSKLGTQDKNEYNKKLDLDNLTLTRKNGKWTLLMPLFSKYVHQGNGSSFSSVTDYIPYECKIPKSITSHDTLCVNWSVIKKSIPDAKDAVSSPKEDLLVVMTDKNLQIFPNPKQNIENPTITIPLHEKERIVANQWAVGQYVSSWDKQLSKYFE